MSYLVLARKYRPRNFEALVGQEHVVQALANALTQQRLHHAYLFTGTRGVGKTTVSRILAKSLNCTGADGQGGITAEPCGVCQACTEIDADRYLDYTEMDAASTRGIDDIRDLIERAAYKPGVGRFKVFMVDEAHQLTKEAFNSLLKTLEEPPDYLKFVLATTDPDKMPATVLSRCLQFNLRPMAPQTIQSHLAMVLAAEGISADAGALRLIARAARGSMRDALSLTDQAIAYGAGALVESSVRQMLGAVDRSHARRLVEALAARDGAALVGVVDALRALGLSAGGTLEELAALLQQMALAQAVPQALDAQDPETPEVIRLAGSMAADETQLLYSIVLQGRAEIGLAPDEHSGLVMVLLRWLAFAPAPGQPEAPPPRVTPVGRAVASAAAARESAAAPTAATASATAATSALAPTRVSAAMVAVRPATSRNVARAPEPPPWLDVPPEVELEARPSQARERLPDPAAAPRAGAIAPPAATATFDLQPTPLGNRWDRQVRTLLERGSVTALARELAFQAQCVAIEGSVWMLRVERESLRAPAQRDRLQAALVEALGEPVTLQIELGATSDTPARRDAAERALRQQQAEQIIQDDPLVQALMHQYSTARVVPGSVKPH